MAKVKVLDAGNDISNSELEHLIDEWCHNQKYRTILKLKLIDGLTYEEVAEEVDMSDRQIKRIVHNHGDRILLHHHHKQNT